MDFLYLQRALELAETRKGFTAPNPSVGAVLVKDGKVLAEGVHWASGHAHAEIEVLKQVPLDLDLSTATLFTSLEPCCHWGKTPPCTQALIQRKVGRVVYALEDPNPLVSGKSKQLLSNQGIQVEHQPFEGIIRFYTSYDFHTRNQRPFITAKLAVTLDGMYAGTGTQRVFISGPDAERFVHQKRRQADAILTSGRTIQLDDPLLNCRLDGTTIAKPVFIVDKGAETPLTSRVFSSASEITLFHSETAPEASLLDLKSHGIRLIPTPSNAGALSLPWIASYLGKLGLQDVWLESGASLSNSFLRESLIQEVFLVVAPKWLGGGKPWADANTLSGFSVQSWIQSGEDGICHLRHKCLQG